MATSKPGCCVSSFFAWLLTTAIFVSATASAQIVTTIAGTTPGFSGDGGPATLAQLNSNWGMTINHTTGDIYVCDFSNSRVRKISLATGLISTFAGTGVPGYSGDGGPATLAQLNFPNGIEIDNAGNVYIDDIYNHRIRKVTPAGIITTYAGNGVYAATGDGGPAAAASIGTPNGLGMDAANNLYIPDYLPNTLRKVTSGSTIINTIAGTAGVPGYSGDGGPALGATMNLVNDVSVDAANNVYISDWNNNAIRKVNTSGIISTYCGTGIAGFSGDGGPASSAMVRGPMGFYFDCDNTMVICDVDNHRIRTISPSGIINTVGGNGSAAMAGDGGPATLASFNRPVKVVLDAIGNIYVSDRNNGRIRKISVGKVVCQGATIPFCDRTGTGTWASSNVAVATVSSGGIVTGVTPGTSTITLTLPAGYYVTGTVTVNPAPAPFTGTFTVCVGSTTSITPPASSGTWSITPTSVATVSTSGVVTGVSPGTATLSFTTAACGSVTAVVTVNPMPGPIGGNVPLCVGNTMTLTDPVPGGTWSCAPASVATISSTGTVSAVGPGTAIVSYTNPCGSVTAVITVNAVPGPITGGGTICIGGSITLSNSVAGGMWSITPTTVATISSTGVVTGISPGTATVSYTTPCGYVTTVVVVNSTTLTISEGGQLCVGSTLAMSSSTSGGTWTCSPIAVASVNASGVVTGASAGTATVTYTSTCGSVMAVVTVISTPSAITGMVPLCPGNTATLSSATPGGTWSCTPAAVATIDASGIVTALAPGTAIVSYSNECGPTTAIITVSTIPAPVITSNAPVCEGDILRLFATHSSAGGTFSWSYPDGGSSSAQNPQRPNVTVAASGIYTVTYSINTCSSSATANIHVYPYVHLYDVTMDQTIKLGASVQLNALGAVFYSWTPAATLDNPSINNPEATPSALTIYTVVGTNEGGCADTAMVTIDVEDDGDEFIPTAFTPNGDGRNDIFRIKGLKGEKLVEFSIYNRWGERVYHNEYKTEEGWDGIYKGVQQDNGVYNYFIIIAKRDGTNKMYKGDVTLIR